MDLSRRDVLRLAVTGGVTSLAAACAGSKEAPKPVSAPAPAPDRMPVVFISHGSPMVAITRDDYSEALKWMGEDLPRPKAIVVVSAHWQEERPIRVTSGAHPETIHDFGGFPEKLY